MAPRFPYERPGHWYKGNVHAHSTASDGGLPPQEAAEFYRSRGYDFFALTDHGRLCDAAALTSDGFVCLPGEELSNPHLVGLGLAEEIADSLDFQGQIDAVLGQGGLPIVAHPAWMGLRVEEIAAASGLLGLEIYNFICAQLNGKGLSLNIWDELLARGYPLWGLAVDDAHLSDAHPGGAAGWVVVRAPELSAEAILSSIREGSFYASTGPSIEEIVLAEVEVEGSHSLELTVRCAPCEKIIFVGAAHHGKRFTDPAGGLITEATFRVRPTMGYCRVECHAPDGTTAWTNPIFLD